MQNDKYVQHKDTILPIRNTTTNYYLALYHFKYSFNKYDPNALINNVMSYRHFNLTWFLGCTQLFL